MTWLRLSFTAHLCTGKRQPVTPLLGAAESYRLFFVLRCAHWIPACAGMTPVAGCGGNTNSVIPAKAGIQIARERAI
jgi:hypothetical protein